MREFLRYRLRFFGYVQGVGFRYTAQHAAEMLGLTGYVKNEYDGSVSCEVQGEKEVIDRFIELIHTARYIEVSRMEKEKMPIDMEERSFRVKH